MVYWCDDSGVSEIFNNCSYWWLRLADIEIFNAYAYCIWIYATVQNAYAYAYMQTLPMISLKVCILHMHMIYAFKKVCIICKLCICILISMPIVRIVRLA